MEKEQKIIYKLIKSEIELLDKHLKLHCNDKVCTAYCHYITERKKLLQKSLNKLNFKP